MTLPQTPKSRLDGRTALVTGASKDLGLAAAGAPVVLFGIIHTQITQHCQQEAS
ncbi:hypothetical protein [Halomonas urmiana]|uniref:hypothetical protein n=1 Tax=Halomonas urmiana TaxID=490901 RepID=UPI001EFF79EC|nr:hypothetical protein [Halomonas urmiana]